MDDKLEKHIKDFIYELVDTFFGPLGRHALTSPCRLALGLLAHVLALHDRTDPRPRSDGLYQTGGNR